MLKGGEKGKFKGKNFVFTKVWEQWYNGSMECNAYLSLHVQVCISLVIGTV